MANYYLSIETTGLDPKKDKIITIQYQELDRTSGKPAGELIILKEWESSEKEIIEKFIISTKIKDSYPFTFVPVGYNLNFVSRFLKERTRINKIGELDILEKPFIDLRAFGIIMNKGEFKGSGLEKITGKEMDGKQIPAWFEKKEFDKIIKFIVIETNAFIELNKWLYREMPKFLERFQKESMA